MNHSLYSIKIFARSITVLILFIFTSIASPISANNGNWHNISSYSNTIKIVENEDFQYIATSGGLAVIELSQVGNDTLYLNRGNSPLPSNVIIDIILDKEDVLWISTSKGSIRYKDGNWFSNPKTLGGHFSPPTAPNTSAVFMAAGDSLYLFDYDAHFEAWKIPHWLDDVTQLVLDEVNEILYVGLVNWFAPSGVLAWKNGEWLISEEGSELFASSYYYTLAMRLDADNNLWVAGDSSYQINNGQLIGSEPFTVDAYPNTVWMKNLDNQLFLYMDFNQVEPFEVLYQLSNGIWTEIDSNDLDQEIQAFLFDPLKSIPGPYPLASHQIRDLQIEEEIVYINAREQLFRVDDNTWEELSQKPNFPEAIDRMTVTSSGTIWVSAGLELFQYDAQLSQWERFEIPATLEHVIEHLTTDNNGGIWMQSHTYLIHINETVGAFDVYEAIDHGYNSTVFHDIICLQDGTVWFSGFDGLLYFDGSDWTHYQDIGSPSNYTYQLALDTDENLWFRQNGLLGIFLNDDFNYIDLPFGNAGSPHSSMKFDDNNKLWISGTEKLTQYSNGNFTTWTMENSCLTDGSQLALDFDAAGNVWLGSGWQGGISIFNENGLQDLLINGLETVLGNQEYFIIYPNPLKLGNRLKVKVQLENSNELIFSVYNLQGESFGPAKHHQISDELWEVELPYLPSGQYLIRSRAEQEVRSSLFIVD